MRTLLQMVEKVLDHDVNLLLLGESGSGKDYVAEAAYRSRTSSRSSSIMFPPTMRHRTAKAAAGSRAERSNSRGSGSTR